jgi:DNA polymerase-3 subunit delta
VIHLLYGEDSLSIREKLTALKEMVEPPEVRDVNVAVFEGARLRLEQLRAACEAVPFLAERRLVVVEGLLARMERRQGRAVDEASAEEGPDLGEWTKLADLLMAVPPTTDLVFVEGKLQPNNPLLARAKPLAQAMHYVLPKGDDLRTWIRQRAESKGIRIHPRAVVALADAVGSDLPVLDAELDKLAIYCWQREIGYQDVQDMVAYTREANVFATVDAMLENRPGPALAQVAQHLESGESPGWLMGMIVRQVRLLLLAKELRAEGVRSEELGSRLGLQGFALRKTLEQEPRYTRPQLVEAYDVLLKADLGLKTSATDEETALDLLVADLCALYTWR